MTLVFPQIQAVLFPLGKKQKGPGLKKHCVSATCLGDGVSLYADGGFCVYTDCISRSVVIEEVGRV